MDNPAINGMRVKYVGKQAHLSGMTGTVLDVGSDGRWPIVRFDQPVGISHPSGQPAFKQQVAARVLIEIEGEA